MEKVTGTTSLNASRYSGSSSTSPLTQPTNAQLTPEPQAQRAAAGAAASSADARMLGLTPVSPGNTQPKPRPVAVAAVQPKPAVRTGTPPKPRAASAAIGTQPVPAPTLPLDLHSGTTPQPETESVASGGTVQNATGASVCGGCGAAVPVLAETNPWVEVELERQRDEIGRLHATVGRLSRDVALLLQGWQQRMPTSTQGKRGEGATVYWYNTVTDTSSWTQPTLAPRTPRTPRNGDRRSSERQDGSLQEHSGTNDAATSAGEGEGSRRPMRSVSFGEDRVLEIDSKPLSEASATIGDGPPSLLSPVREDEVLEEGWELSVSESTGQRYYYHPATGKSQWEPPTGRSSSSLPEPWEERMSSSKQKVYFFNTATGESVWERPGSTEAKDPAQGSSPGSSSLPEPWEQRRSSSTQKVYYFNPTSGESVWERPGSDGSDRSGSRARGRARTSDAGMFACCAAPTNQGQ
jgi:hypothetical protein